MTQNPQNQVMQNLNNRQMLLSTSPRMSKKLGSFSGSPGETTRVKLFNVGVMTKVRLLITANVTIGTAVTTASPKAPFNMIQNIRFQDFEGTERVNLSGYQLWVLNSARARSPAFKNNESGTNRSGLPLVPTSVATNNIQFYIEVPLAFDAERDLRGAILAQTAVGEQYLNITWNNLFHADGNDDAVYNGGSTSTVAVNSITCDLWQDYMIPQQIGGQMPLPLADLLTVYELNGNFRLTDNLSNGQERLINYPNVRSVIGAYINWQNNGVMADSISRVRLVANGNNVLHEEDLQTQLSTQREWCNSDLPIGTFFKLHRSRPIETAMYGNVQLGLTMSAAPTGNFYLEQMFESFYAKGSALPCIDQS
jgi:hypothetical protein